MKKQEIVDGDWDYLIILDACRYDYFKELYENYDNLKKGKLEKRKSRGSHTTEWLEKTFPDKYLYTYLSSNPFVNSQGLPLSKTTAGQKSNWNPKETFKKIIDVWKTHWDEEKNTVKPEDMLKVAKNHLKDEKVIIHFVQPHQPFLTSEFEEEQFYVKKRVEKSEEDKGSTRRKMLDILRRIADPIWGKLNRVQRHRIRRLLGIKERDIFVEFYEDGKIEELKQYYKENLEIALENVEKLIEIIPGGSKIIITADHGEAFGEDGLLEHTYGSSHPILREVPWLEINKEKTEKNKIKNRLRKIKRKDKDDESN